MLCQETSFRKTQTLSKSSFFFHSLTSTLRFWVYHPFPHFGHKNNLNFSNNSSTWGCWIQTERLANKLFRRIMLGKEVLANYSVRNCQCNELRDWFRWIFLSRKNPWVHKAINYAYVEINLVKAFFFCCSTEVKEIDLSLPEFNNYT